MKNQEISYKDLYTLVDDRFNRFEEKLDDRIGQLHERIDRVQERINPLERTVQRLWIYAGIAIAGVVMMIELGISALRKHFNL